jgi:hypothetical protein
MDDITLSDDLTPSVSPGVYQPEPDPALTAELNAEQNMILAAGPMLDKILGWFDGHIDALSRVQGLNPESKIPLEAQLIGLSEATGRMIALRGELEAMKDGFIKKSPN